MPDNPSPATPSPTTTASARPSVPSMTAVPAGRPTAAADGAPPSPRRRFGWLPGFLLVLPSMILIGIFVYYLIVRNVATSLTNRNSINKNLVVSNVGLRNYGRLFADSNYQHALWHLLVLSVAFIGGTMVFGLLWALLLEKGIRGEGVFRAVYLFPMAISFIAASVVWKWLLSPQKGPQSVGLNQLFHLMGMDGLQSSWWSANSSLNMAAMALPAVWQLAGYVMALFLAGFRGIPDDQREAARMDGASEYRIYRHVIFPQLSPIALSALIIVGHMSMKMFDLIYALAGSNSYVASVPATLLWQQLSTYKYATAAANTTILLLIVAILVVPYLIYTRRVEKRAGS